MRRVAALAFALLPVTFLSGVGAGTAHADATEVFWRGGVPCTAALSQAQRIPGATLTRDGDRVAAYRLPGASKLLVVHSERANA